MLMYVALAVWSVIGPGGGGAQFLPTVSPHDSRTVVTRCDMTGAYITHDAGANWRMFNLRGVVSFFVFDPRDRNVIYAGSTGLYRSADAGRTWSLIYPDPKEVVRVDMPDDHASEVFVTGRGNAPRITALAVDPGDSGTLYAAMGSRRAGLALQVSKDRGRSWSQIAELPGSALRIHVANGEVLVIGGEAVTVCRGSACQQRRTPGTFTDASAAGRTIYATGEKGVQVSEDGGATWRRAAFEPRAIAVGTTAADPKVAYVSYTQGENFGVARTSDAGRTWNYVWKEGREASPNIHDGWLSERFGPHWGGEPLNLGVAPTDPNICYATNLGATMRTLDGGRTWQGVYSRKAEDGGAATNGMDVTTTYGVHFDPFDAKRIFISYTDIGLFGSENGGASWHSYSRTAPRRWVNTTYWMEFDPEVKGRAWAVMSGTHDLPRPKMWRRRGPSTYVGGVTISDDGGRTWRVASESLPPCAPTHIVLDPASPKGSRTLYITAFGRGVFKSTDGGRNWVLKNNGIAGKEPFAWRLVRDPQGVLYLVVARRREDGLIGSPEDGALYRSRDGAEHWERIALPEGVNGPNGLALDPADPKRLYLAAWGRQGTANAVDGGIYLSTDAGATWRRVLDRDQHVYDVTTDPREPRTLYACGFSNSAWRSTDRGVTWKRIPGYNFKWGHRVVPDPHRAGMVYITTFGGSVWYGPAVGDPKSSEDIATRLPDR